MTSGFCKAYRRVWSHEDFKDLLEASIWNYIYQNAFFEDGECCFNGQILHLKRGQIAVTPRFLAKGFRVSESSIRTFLKRLIKLKSITIQTTTKATIISVCNYEVFQYSVKSNSDQTETKMKTNYANNKEEKETKETKEEKETIIPDWIPKEPWKEFMKVREKLKAKNTDYAKKVLINSLAKMKEQGHCPTDIINTSILNNWKGVFAPNNINQKNNRRQNESSSYSKNEAISRGIAAAIQEIDNEPDSGLGW